MEDFFDRYDIGLWIFKYLNIYEFYLPHLLNRLKDMVYNKNDIFEYTLINSNINKLFWLSI